MNKEREKLIGARLRAFRESLQIPRTTFAVSLGFSSERMASYESGRAMLPYEVFRAVAKRYHLSARWLNGKKCSPQINGEFDESQFINEIKPRTLFSEFYDAHLADKFKEEDNSHMADFKLDQAKLRTFFENLDYDAMPPEARELLKNRLIIPLALMYKKMNQNDDFKLKTDANLTKVLASPEFCNEIDLTNESEFRNYEIVKSEIEKLIDRVRHLVSAKGMKVKLADALKVPSSRVSEWLAGKYEPSGEIALRLLKWVEQQERK